MNKGFYEENDDFCLISDDSGNIKLVRKEKDYYKFGDIFQKENELSALKINYDELQVKYNDLLKKQKIFKILSTIGLSSSVGVLLLVILMPIFNINYFLVSIPMASWACYLSYIDNKKEEIDKKVNSAYKDIAKLFSDISCLNWEITDMKLKTKFEEVKCIHQSNPINSKDDYTIYDLGDYDCKNEDSPKVRIIHYNNQPNKNNQ